ncbi:MAG: hypothetical protein R6V06_01630 [Kiritimatiellia bacterium]
MRVYLDSSIVLRQLIGTKSPWKEWGNWTEAYASTLLRTECYRMADLLRLTDKIDDAQRSRLGSWIERVCESITLVPVTDRVLNRAAGAFPTSVGTDQAIHLATLQELQSTHGISCMLATVDKDMLCAAESMGFNDALRAVSEPEKAEQKPDDSGNAPEKRSTSGNNS